MRDLMSIVEEFNDKDPQRALSCIDQIVNGSAPSDMNSELLRHDMETLLGDAVRYGIFDEADEKALRRMRHSLAQAIDWTPKRKTETVSNIRDMLKRFLDNN